ncbi:hypothetical protein [Anaerococcus jeddahensis]|uniref:hypothetical protein n=1 Tax=Anaerococcus jeddahensis TaxID=1673719 RepID=UPI0006727078|nr:hypothetical protein [Anaerococcus jeddahensis]
MKREYSYGSIILVEIIIAIVSFGIYMAFGEKANESTIFSIISSIITWLGSFVIASGLINNRKGRLGDYLNQIGRLDKKAIIVNLLLIAITVLLTVAFGGGAGFAAVKDNPAGILSAGLLGTILTAIFAIFTAYANHIVSDPRNKDQSIPDAFKSVFSIGGKLFGKTILLYLLYIVLPLILIFGIIIGIIVGADSVQMGIGITIVGAGILGIYFILISPIIAARLADNYLNLTGDIEGENKIIENEDDFTITRNV